MSAAHEDEQPKPDDWYWILATLWEAEFGLGNTAAAKAWEGQARAIATKPWMAETTVEQIGKLSTLLA